MAEKEVRADIVAKELDQQKKQNATTKKIAEAKAKSVVSEQDDEVEEVEEEEEDEEIDDDEEYEEVEEEYEEAEETIVNSNSNKKSNIVDTKAKKPDNKKVVETEEEEEEVEEEEEEEEVEETDEDEESADEVEEVTETKTITKPPVKSTTTTTTTITTKGQSPITKTVQNIPQITKTEINKTKPATPAIPSTVTPDIKKTETPKGESLLLPLLQGLLHKNTTQRTISKNANINKSSNSAIDNSIAPANLSSKRSNSKKNNSILHGVEDSGTESGEDLKLLAAGLQNHMQQQDNINSKKNSNKTTRKTNNTNDLITDVTTALARLQKSLCDGKDLNLDAIKRNTLLNLVSRLQVGLTSPEKLQALTTTIGTTENCLLLPLSQSLSMDENRFSKNSSSSSGSGSNRFSKRKNRPIRHTVGVSQEEIDDARRLMEEQIFIDNLSNASSSVNSSTSTLTVTQNKLTNTTCNSHDGGGVGGTNQLYRPNQFVPKNLQPTIKPSSTTEVVVQMRDNNKQMRQQKQLRQSLSLDQKPVLVKQMSIIDSNYNRRPFSETIADQSAVHFDQPNPKNFDDELKYTTNPLFNGGARGTRRSRTPPGVRGPLNNKFDNDNADDLSMNKFNSRKLRMKRANTIDIPKQLEFENNYGYYEDYEYDNSDDDDDENRVSQNENFPFGLKGTIKPGTSTKNLSKIVVPPAFKPKTENDLKFLAFIQKQSTNNGLAWTNPNKNLANVTSESNWTNKFGNIKNAFENSAKSQQHDTAYQRPSIGTLNSARNFWKQTETTLNANPILSRKTSTNTILSNFTPTKTLEQLQFEKQQQEQQRLQKLQQQEQLKQQQQLQQQKLYEQQLQQQKLHEQQLQQQKLYEHQLQQQKLHEQQLQQQKLQEQKVQQQRLHEQQLQQQKLYEQQIQQQKLQEQQQKLREQQLQQQKIYQQQQQLKQQQILQQQQQQQQQLQQQQLHQQQLNQQQLQQQQNIVSGNLCIKENSSKDLLPKSIIQTNNLTTSTNQLKSLNPLNQFSHAPASAFQPIPSKQSDLPQIPNFKPIQPVSAVTNLTNGYHDHQQKPKTQLKLNINDSNKLPSNQQASPTKNLSNSFLVHTDANNKSPTTTNCLPWINKITTNDNHRVLKLAATKFESNTIHPDPIPNKNPSPRTQSMRMYSTQKQLQQQQQQQPIQQSHSRFGNRIKEKRGSLPNQSTYSSYHNEFNTPNFQETYKNTINNENLFSSANYLQQQQPSYNNYQNQQIAAQAYQSQLSSYNAPSLPNLTNYSHFSLPTPKQFAPDNLQKPQQQQQQHFSLPTTPKFNSILSPPTVNKFDFNRQNSSNQLKYSNNIPSQQNYGSTQFNPPSPKFHPNEQYTKPQYNQQVSQQSQPLQQQNSQLPNYSYTCTDYTDPACVSTYIPKVTVTYDTDSITNPTGEPIVLSNYRPIISPNKPIELKQSNYSQPQQQLQFQQQSPYQYQQLEQQQSIAKPDQLRIYDYPSSTETSPISNVISPCSISSNNQDIDDCSEETELAAEMQEYTAAKTQVMKGPVSQTAVTVTNKTSHIGDSYHGKGSVDAKNLHSALKNIKSKTVSVTKTTGTTQKNTIPSNTSVANNNNLTNLKSNNLLNYSKQISTNNLMNNKNLLNSLNTMKDSNQQQKINYVHNLSTTTSNEMNGTFKTPTIIETPSTPITVNKTDLPGHIVFNNINNYTNYNQTYYNNQDHQDHFGINRTPNPITKSDSWKQICQAAAAQKSPSPNSCIDGRPIQRTKSGNTLNLPKQFEAGIKKTEISEKQKTVAAYFSGQKSPNSLSRSSSQQNHIDQLDNNKSRVGGAPQQTQTSKTITTTKTKTKTISPTLSQQDTTSIKKSSNTSLSSSISAEKTIKKKISSVTRIKTSEKASIGKQIPSSGLARSHTMPLITNINLLDESNVDDAFEDLFNSSLAA